MSHVFLVGFMGAGKSTVGRRLATLLDMPFVDLDEVVAKAAGSSIPEIFAASGEDGFRSLEREALSAVVAGGDAVVACGGGIVTRPENVEALSAAGTVVYLRTTAEETVSRVSDLASRPLLAGPNATAEASRLLAERSALYEQAADIQVDTVGSTPAAVAASIVTALTERSVK